MLQNLSHKFRSGCLMLARKQGESVTFLGTCFLVHREGYLLTAAHLVSDPEGLVAVPTSQTDDFTPFIAERVAAFPVERVGADTVRDVALLRLTQDIEIDVPYDFLGSTGGVRPGASLMSLGYSFGHLQAQTLMGYDSVVAAKVRSSNGTALIFYNSPFHEGDRGGPLIHVADGHIIGIVNGRFDPADFVADGASEYHPLDPREANISYAVAIEYGLDLLREIGINPTPGISE
ncbi:MAG: trypsin-like peptidase domain-containing protein [Gammaproteobacteria bacterium]|nr:trypsin-like peptidase domain-containing protein [Gammaproteobacteria bacterium]